MEQHRPYEDEKHHWLFIESHRVVSTEGHERWRVQVCRDCGRFEVYGDKDGVHFRVGFDLPTDELVEAAGKYARMLKEDDEAAQMRQAGMGKLSGME